MENKLRTGAKQNLKSRIKKIFRPKLARAAKPFDWTLDLQLVQQRFAKLGNIPIKNQDQSDSCGGQAGSYWLGVSMALGANQNYSEVSAKSIYAPIAYPSGGTTDADLENQISNIGAIAESIIPSYRPDGTTDEVWMTDKSWMTQPNIILAGKDANWVQVSVANDLNSIACAIRDYGATIWHINSFFTAPNWTSPSPQRTTETFEGHFMCQPLVAIYQGNNAIKSFQSWGELVGDNGYQYFTERTFISAPDIKDIFTFVPKYVPHPVLPNQSIPNPAIITWQQRLVNWFGALFN